MTSFALDGHVALVTGSSRGLGRAMAFALGRAGAKVAHNYCHSQETAERAFADFQAEGLEGVLVRADVVPLGIGQVGERFGERVGRRRRECDRGKATIRVFLAPTAGNASAGRKRHLAGSIPGVLGFSISF